MTRTDVSGELFSKLNFIIAFSNSKNLMFEVVFEVKELNGTDTPNLFRCLYFTAKLSLHFEVVIMVSTIT